MDAQGPRGNLVPEVRSAMAGRWLSAGAMGLLVVLATSGAATHPEGIQIGVPTLGNLALAVLTGAIVHASGVTALGGFLAPASAALLAAWLPPFPSFLLLFSGPPLFVFVLAGLLLSAVARRVRPPRVALVPVFFALYSGVAYQAQTRVGPDGDEPQYLMVAESLIRDQDLVLDRDFEEERYAAFSSRPLEPHFRIRGREGQIYSLHAVGLPILILPAYALLGYAGASYFMAFVAALLVRELRRLVFAITGEDALAEGTAWLVGLSPPLIHFAGLLFTEVPAALLLCVGLRTALFARAASASLAAALCAAMLPWLNVRYAILSAAIAGALLWRLWREGEAASLRFRLALPALVMTGSALAMGVFHFELWGFWDPRRVYGRSREFAIDVLPEGLPGLFFDQEFGLFAYAPIFVLSLSGLVHLWRRHRSVAFFSILTACGVIATASVWPMWRGGFNPPARFLVPLIPVLAVSLAFSLKRGLRPATALLAGWSLWCGLSGALNFETVHRDRDGVAPFFRTQSGAREWTAALPSFVLPEDRPTRSLVWPWSALLGLPLLFSLTRPLAHPRLFTCRDTLLAAAALMATAAFADRMSPRVRSPEHDAARLLGSPSILLPSLRVRMEAEAAWPLDLFYEPHRSPNGLAFAKALTLKASRYSLTLSLKDKAAPTRPPSVLIQHRHGRAWTLVPMISVGGGLQGAFTIDQSGDYDLALQGGEPVAIEGVRLAPQT